MEEPLRIGNILSEMQSPVLVLSFLGERRTSDILEALQFLGVQNVLYLQLSISSGFFDNSNKINLFLSEEPGSTDTLNSNF